MGFDVMMEAGSGLGAGERSGDGDAKDRAGAVIGMEEAVTGDAL